MSPKTPEGPYCPVRSELAAANKYGAAGTLTWEVWTLTGDDVNYECGSNPPSQHTPAIPLHCPFKPATTHLASPPGADQSPVLPLAARLFGPTCAWCDYALVIENLLRSLHPRV